jgi:hypothetical protein
MIVSALRATLICAVVTAAACAPDSSSSARPTPTVRDSAGIQIVENPPVTEQDLPFWSVDTVPALTIGQLDGDPAYEFTSIQNVTQLANGMIVVVDGQGESTSEFRFYDAAGKHVATHGRTGQGPGEFQWVNFIGGAGGDTVVAVDFPARRISWLSAAGGFVRSMQVDEARFKRLIGEDITNIAEGMTPLGDSLFATRAWRRKVAEGAARASYSQFDLVDFARDTVLTAGRHDEPTPTRLELSRGPQFFESTVETAIGLHVVDRERARLCVASTQRAELTCVDNAGERRITRWQPDVVPYTTADRRELEERVRTSYVKYYGPVDTDVILGALQWPTQFNPIRAIRNDAEGNTWVLEYAADSTERKHLRFRVLDPDGSQIAFASGFPLSPYGLNNPVFISASAIMRRVTNTDGVEQIAVYPIRKDRTGR